MTKIVSVIDKSGSMAGEVQKTINGFKEFVESTERDLPESTLSLILFNDKIDMVYTDQPINHVKPLNKDTYIPMGMTALYDAIGKACSLDLGKDAIVCIITDGAENSSKEYRSLTALKTLIKKKETEENWNFIFLGNDLQTANQGTNLGISKSVSYDGDAFEGYVQMSKTVRSIAKNR